MKLNGKKITTANEVVIPIIRTTGNLYFVARAVEDPGEYDRMLKLPPPVTVEEPGKTPEKVQTSAYRRVIEGSFDTYIAFYVVKSLVKIGTIETVNKAPIDPDDEPEVTQTRVYQPVEWETIDFADLKSYTNFKQELLDAGLNVGEITRITNGVMEANSLTEAGVDRARDDFLALPEGQP
jgi:hypothetical protein